MEMFKHIRENVRDFNDDEEITAFLAKILDGKAGDGSGKIYGLGHAVYTISDPRAVLLKRYAAEMAEKNGRTDEFRLMESVERLGLALLADRKKLTIPMCANVDMYSGLVYNMLGIPDELFTPLFAIARITGWSAHRIEEVTTCGKIIRPAYRAAFKPREYIPMRDRK
jgi:citrate synthase